MGEYTAEPHLPVERVNPNIVWEIDNDDSDFPYNTIFMRPFLRINTTHQWHARTFDEIRREPSVHSRLSALWEDQ